MYNHIEVCKVLRGSFNAINIVVNITYVIWGLILIGQVLSFYSNNIDSIQAIWKIRDVFKDCWEWWKICLESYKRLAQIKYL